jgi:hypothetical protein
MSNDVSAAIERLVHEDAACAIARHVAIRFAVERGHVGVDHSVRLLFRALLNYEAAMTGRTMRTLSPHAAEIAGVIEPDVLDAYERSRAAEMNEGKA